jgi:diadenosine tetraphosphatase ApaH/serine/threonine PP2A family protein phosphatase
VLGLLYDVHGNLPALEAVLDDCPAERFVLGGDYAAFGAWPRETVERLRGLDAEWVRGNVDRWLVDRSDAPDEVVPLVDKAREALDEEVTEWLAGLPESFTDGGVLYCHAAPGSDMTPVPAEPSDEDAELFLGVEAERVVFGHTHIQFERPGPGGLHLVNPGSVGIPLDGDRRPAYALAHDDGGVELRRVEYDWRASAKAVRERVGEIPAKRIEQARFDVS